MSRPSFRRTMTLESLEKREVLSAAPDGLRQYALELINLARTNPSGAADWITAHADDKVQRDVAHFGVDLNQELSQIRAAPAQPPLAWSDALGVAAQGQSQDQADHNFQGHNGSDGSDLSARLNRVGYGDLISAGEDAFAYAKSVDHSMAAFLIDWGFTGNNKPHRQNILQNGVSAADAFSEVGIGIVHTGNDGTATTVGPNVVTIDFGRPKNGQPQVLGVAYDDKNGNGSYDLDEGHAGVHIHAVNLDTQASADVDTAGGGGYQFPLAPGKYELTATVGGSVVGRQDVTMGTQNLKVDFNLTNPTVVAPATPTQPATAVATTATTDPSASTPTPALAPAPTPAPTPTPQPDAAPAPVVTPTPDPAPASASVHDQSQPVVQAQAQVLDSTPQPQAQAQSQAPSQAQTQSDAAAVKTATPADTSSVPTSIPASVNPLGWITSWALIRGQGR